MSSINLSSLTIKKAHDALMGGDFSARELAQACLDAISARDAGPEGIHAYLEVYDDVLAQADAADARIGAARKAGESVSALCGIPIAVKDNMLVRGKRAGSASKILEGYVAPYDATAIAKLRAAGAVFIGRTNMDEFAMGSSTENSAYGPTRNPRDLLRVPGGSSGGSAAAVAADFALASLGSDTGGSIRQPASHCGVVGLKPTYGSVSRYGLMAMGSSLDVIGPFAKTVEDAEILFDAIRGADRFDSTSINVAGLRSPAAPARKSLGVPRKFLSGGGIDPAITAAFDRALERLKSLGYEIRDVDLPNIEYSLAVYYVLMPAEVSTNLARFDGVKYGLHKAGATLLDDYLNTRTVGFGPEARRRIMLGAYVLSSGYYDAYYHKAAAVRELIKRDFAKAFESVDAILMPTAPSPAFRFGEKTFDPVAMYLEDIFTVTANLVGVPAISIPMGEKEIPADGNGGAAAKLPLGLQIIAPEGREDALFSLGKAFEGEVQ